MVEIFCFVRLDSSRSLLCDFFIDEGFDYIVYMCNLVVLMVDKNVLYLKMNVLRKIFVGEKIFKYKIIRKMFWIVERCGNVCFKVIYFREKYEFEVYLVNVMGFLFKYSKFLNLFVKLLFKILLKYFCCDSKVIKNMCNLIFD